MTSKTPIDDEDDRTATLRLTNMISPGRSEIEIGIYKGCIDVCINQQFIPALIDTGASISIIKKSFLNSLQKNIKIPLAKANIKLFLADGSVQCVKKLAKLSIDLKENKGEGGVTWPS